MQTSSVPECSSQTCTVEVYKLCTNPACTDDTPHSVKSKVKRNKRSAHILTGRSQDYLRETKNDQKQFYIQFVVGYQIAFVHRGHIAYSSIRCIRTP